MIHKIANGILTVEISSLGAELTSVKDKNGREFIYQPSDLWVGQAKNLFPNVGHAKDDYAIIRGEKYPMHQHGFAKNMPFQVRAAKPDSVILELKSNSRTKAFLPYEFTLMIVFLLEENRLKQTYTVYNGDMDAIYFGIGCHTGLNSGAGSYVDFFGNDAVQEICRKNMKYLTGEKKPYPVPDGKLSVNSEHFGDGAHILTEFADKRLKLVNPSLHSAVTLNFSDFPYLTLWSTPDAETLLCMMPWYALPDHEDTSHIFEQKGGNVCLPPQETFMATQLFTFETL